MAKHKNAGQKNIPAKANAAPSNSGKASRRSERTKANVERRAKTLAHKLARAAERRTETPNGRGYRETKAKRQEAARRVSVKRATRDRLKGMTPKERAQAISNGERQWGDKCKGHHRHQRDNGLARALTGEEFQKLQRDRKAEKKAGGNARVTHA